MLCVQLNWREPAADTTKLESAATDLMLAMNWAMGRQMDRAAPEDDDSEVPVPAVWLVGHGFGGVAAITGE